MGELCPLCGRDVSRRGSYLLYGHPVCKKCYYGLANRRQLAFVLDWIAFQILVFFVAFLLGIVLVSIGTSRDTLDRLGTLIGWATVPVFLCKDGFGGMSPGKAIMGVQVVGGDRNQPAGFGTSLKRNLPLLIPFMPLIVGFTLAKGERIGDGWADSKVIWRKHADSPVFATACPWTPAPETAELVPSAEPVVDDGNPYRSPLG